MLSGYCWQLNNNKSMVHTENRTKCEYRAGIRRAEPGRERSKLGTISQTRIVSKLSTAEAQCSFLLHTCCSIRYCSIEDVNKLFAEWNNMEIK